jgi:hypothetical protein
MRRVCQFRHRGIHDRFDQGMSVHSTNYLRVLLLILNSMLQSLSNDSTKAINAAISTVKPQMQQIIAL